jgi:hypothetical protein
VTGRNRRAGVVVVVTAALLAVVAPAWGGVKAKATHAAQSATSAKWGAAGSTNNGSPSIGSPFTMSWTINLLGVNPQFFKVVNTGTIDLTAETYTTTISGGPKITLTACVGDDWSTLLGLGGSCSGTTVGLGDSSSGATTASVPIPAGSYVSVKASASGLLSLGSYTTTINVRVSRGQARAATTTNS